ncbi:hypothetical protein CJP74_05060 [Psittacicella melopsittaci]|uniref:DNA polymerase IV n=1 Tax=Psittacicella melopsittaci TaxID=2028576 RepID=A0A3A1Y4N6_9GAMM|nr:DNA polymerase IV [Psittacicella melopsittaci]RIY32259.1 hypothetical protein CJP74_05060 [Psittacicella melopsittaci]
MTIPLQQDLESLSYQVALALKEKIFPPQLPYGDDNHSELYQQSLARINKLKRKDLLQVLACPSEQLSKSQGQSLLKQVKNQLHKLAQARQKILTQGLESLAQAPKTPELFGQVHQHQQFIDKKIAELELELEALQLSYPKIKGYLAYHLPEIKFPLELIKIKEGELESYFKQQVSFVVRQMTWLRAFTPILTSSGTQGKVEVVWQRLLDLLQLLQYKEHALEQQYQRCLNLSTRFNWQLLGAQELALKKPSLANKEQEANLLYQVQLCQQGKGQLKQALAHVQQQLQTPKIEDLFELPILHPLMELVCDPQRSIEQKWHLLASELVSPSVPQLDGHIAPVFDPFVQFDDPEYFSRLILTPENRQQLQLELEQQKPQTAYSQGQEFVPPLLRAEQRELYEEKVAGISQQAQREASTKTTFFAPLTAEDAPAVDASSIYRPPVMQESDGELWLKQQKELMHQLSIHEADGDYYQAYQKVIKKLQQTYYAVRQTIVAPQLSFAPEPANPLGLLQHLGKGSNNSYYYYQSIAPLLERLGFYYTNKATKTEHWYLSSSERVLQALAQRNWASQVYHYKTYQDNYLNAWLEQPLSLTSVEAQSNSALQEKYLLETNLYQVPGATLDLRAYSKVYWAKRIKEKYLAQLQQEHGGLKSSALQKLSLSQLQTTGYANYLHLAHLLGQGLESKHCFVAPQESQEANSLRVYREKELTQTLGEDQVAHAYSQAQQEFVQQVELEVEKGKADEYSNIRKLLAQQLKATSASPEQSLPLTLEDNFLEHLFCQEFKEHLSLRLQQAQHSYEQAYLKPERDLGLNYYYSLRRLLKRPSIYSSPELNSSLLDQAQLKLYLAYNHKASHPGYSRYGQLKRKHRQRLAKLSKDYPLSSQEKFYQAFVGYAPENIALGSLLATTKLFGNSKCVHLQSLEHPFARQNMIYALVGQGISHTPSYLLHQANFCNYGALGEGEQLTKAWYVNGQGYSLHTQMPELSFTLAPEVAPQLIALEQEQDLAFAQQLMQQRGQYFAHYSQYEQIYTFPSLLQRGWRQPGYGSLNYFPNLYHNTWLAAGSKKLSYPIYGYKTFNPLTGRVWQGGEPDFYLPELPASITNPLRRSLVYNLFEEHKHEVAPGQRFAQAYQQENDFLFRNYPQEQEFFLSPEQYLAYYYTWQKEAHNYSAEVIALLNQRYSKEDAYLHKASRYYSYQMIPLGVYTREQLDALAYMSMPEFLEQMQMDKVLPRVRQALQQQRSLYLENMQVDTLASLDLEQLSPTFERVILHCDMNNCFASITMQEHPHLKGKAVIIGGDQEQRKGVVLAASYQAKACGVKTGEPTVLALKKCPGAIVMPPEFETYNRYSELATQIYLSYTSKVENYSIDEVWMDVTDVVGQYESPQALAHKVREHIKRQLGITISVGVSFNKTFAKLGSDLKKPDAVTYISPTNYQEIVWPCPVQDMLGVGSATLAKLDFMNIETIGQLAQTPRDYLEKHLGAHGLNLWLCANALDAVAVKTGQTHDAHKSIGRGSTLAQDVYQTSQVSSILLELATKVSQELHRHNLLATGIAISVRDTKFKDYGGQTKLDLPSLVAKDLQSKGMELFKQIFTWNHPVRALTIRAINLIPYTTELTGNIFSDVTGQVKRNQRQRAIHQINSSLGAKDKARVHAASELHNTPWLGDRSNLMAGLKGPPPPTEKR